MIQYYNEDFEDIPFNELNEDFLDDFNPDDAKQSSKIVIDKAEEEPFNREDYKHNFRIGCERKALRPGGQLMRGQSMKTKVELYNRLLERILVPYLDGMRYIEDYRAGWEPTWSKDDFTPIENTVDFFMDEERFRKDISFVVYFNTYENLRLKRIIWILEQFWNVTQILAKFDQFVSVHTHYTMDDWISSESYWYGIDVHRAVEHTFFEKTKEEKTVRHFVSLFNKSKEVQKEFKEMFKKRKDSENFMNSNYHKSSFISIFKNPEDFSNGKMSIEQKPLAAGEYDYKRRVVFRILKNATVRVQYSYTDPTIEFLVEGTLELWNPFSPDDYYRRNEEFGTKRLAENFQHNEVVILPEFRCMPRKKDAINVSLHGRNINTLIVRCSDEYIEDVEHLKAIINLKGIENVNEIKWQVEENE